MTKIVGENATALRRSAVFVDRAALEVDRAGGHHLEAVFGRHRPVFDLEVLADFFGDLLDDDFAEVERIADRLLFRVEECERRRIFAVAQANDARLVDSLERWGGVGDDQRAGALRHRGVSPPASRIPPRQGPIATTASHGGRYHRPGQRRAQAAGRHRNRSRVSWGCSSWTSMADAVFTGAAAVLTLPVPCDLPARSSPRIARWTVVGTAANSALCRQRTLGGAPIRARISVKCSARARPRMGRANRASASCPRRCAGNHRAASRDRDAGISHPRAR